MYFPFWGFYETCFGYELLIMMVGISKYNYVAGKSNVYKYSNKK